MTEAVAIEELGPGTAAQCEIALERLTAVGVPLGDGLVGIFPLDLPDTMTVAVGVPLPTGTRLPAGLVDGVRPGGGRASTLHVGAYGALALAYAALFEWIAEFGHETVGPVEEVEPGSAPWTRRCWTSR